MAKVYDPLGIASPILLRAKHIYRQICEENHAWDGALRKELELAWKKWLQNLSNEITIPRSLTSGHEKVTEVCLHAFGDASNKGCCAAVYAVVKNRDKQSQGLTASKSRIARKNTSIPRLELVSAHMAANLVDNIRTALEGYNISGTYVWLDSSVALYWIINNKGNWKQFVSNRVEKIRQKKAIEWKHCPSNENPADVGSRGSKGDLSKLWREGPKWLQSPENWPENIALMPTKEVNEEAKIIQKINMMSVTKETSCLHKLLEKHNFWKILRITAWIIGFIFNLTGKPRRCSVLSTFELQEALNYWIKVTQNEALTDPSFEDISNRLVLSKDGEGLLRCRGRIIGENPLYLPSKHAFTKLVIKDAHLKTLHGGVTLTMAKTREIWWIEKLRTLVKGVLYNVKNANAAEPSLYHLCQLQLYRNFEQKDQEHSRQLVLILMEPLEYKVSKKIKAKSYVALYTCATTRAVHDSWRIQVKPYRVHSQKRKSSQDG